ncbi:PfaD family polyunsaturated fatty acid/polyketide biosynthesis protein [bacterium]|nr:PfaD family polyunsaturated fatty acid/polyketide biosynthesis protein [bacterium]
MTIRPQDLGDPSFRSDLGLEYNYLSGAMANGIASVELVAAMARTGMLGFFGAAGLSFSRVEDAIRRLKSEIPDKPFGFNLIHSPNEPRHEMAIAELYIREEIRLVEASAFLDLTLPLIHYRLHGIHRDASGNVVTPNRVIGKVSRIEVATKFFSPAPDRFVQELVKLGKLTPEQARLASEVPVAQDVTAEADSGGHTDNRPAITLVPTIIALRDRLQAKYNYQHSLRVGAAGGISTPASVAAAFMMGAAYVVSGSVNQACVESGSCEMVRKMLAESGQADVAMAPAADMFEMGVKVQVLKRGTMFPMRAQKLYEVYRDFASIEVIPPQEKAQLEKTIFRTSLDEIWNQTKEFFSKRDPEQVTRAEKDPRHKMALVFRWYLGQSSRWANSGEPTRVVDYQIWCGPAMGAFNEWVKGSFLEKPENRKAGVVALNLLHGASQLMQFRISALLGLPQQGVDSPVPMEMEKLRVQSGFAGVPS